MWLGSLIDFLGQTGTHVTITAWSTMFSFPPHYQSLLAFCLVAPFVSVCRYLPLFSVAFVRSSLLPFRSTYVVRRLTAFLIFLHHWYSVSFRFLFKTCFCPFFLVLLVLLCSRTRYACASLLGLPMNSDICFVLDFFLSHGLSPHD